MYSAQWYFVVENEKNTFSYRFIIDLNILNHGGLQGMIVIAIIQSK